MSEITITRALVELKTLEDRITKAMRACKLITFKVREEDREKLTPHNYQKVVDLIAHRKRLKAAIVQSNAVTRVQVAEENYTVAEAIERKRSINFERSLLQTMKQQLADTKQKVASWNTRVEQKLDRLLEVEFGKDVKSNVENVQKISESYMKNNKAEVVDPLRLEEKIEKLENEITRFNAEVDLVLSESNAVTRITV